MPDKCSYFAGFVAFLFIVSVTGSPGAVLAQDVSEDDIRGHIEILANDDFSGRMPGTEGETKTLEYIANQWNKAGLVSGTNDPAHPWYAPVQMVQRKHFGQTVRFAKGNRSLSISDEIILRSHDSSAAVRNAPVVYTGYGVDAQGKVNTDVSGKIALLHFSAPPFAGEDGKSFVERRKQLSDAGAAAVLTIFDGSFPWSRVLSGYTGRSINLQSKDTALPLDGAVSGAFVKRLFNSAKMNWSETKGDAGKADFTGRNLPLNASLLASTQVYRFPSYNVIAKLPGKNPDAGAILMLGHWDHIGICRDEGAEDRICNGAVDNASGIAVLIEAAKRLAKEPQHDRDIYFMGTTAEEQGLLGAYAYAENSNIPLKDIVIALNIDTIAIAPRDAKVAIIGRGETSLDPAIEYVARKLGRDIESSKDANAFIRRQDGWALAAKGVPSLMVGGSFADMELLQKFLGSVYHGPEDEAVAGMELGGAAQDTDLHIALARHFANFETYSAEDWARQTGPEPDKESVE
ncbi:M28 family peptidase [Sphingorhabdus sp. Alg239-R122]|uniref:M28 family peptidase n=1 Tax=Sphingorhabdus sp. Alg239-R122 TaxID=2305989 RepID=UPI0013DC578E|nr:M28 family peptidase [Sphingorhabdus sp. Alg239-R122]